MNLDKSRPYFHVKGDPRLAFEQDGHLFNWQGEQVYLEDVIQEPPKPKTHSEKMKEAWARRKNGG